MELSEIHHRSGLTAIKELLRQGFEVTAFEGTRSVRKLDRGLPSQLTRAPPQAARESEAPGSARPVHRASASYRSTRMEGPSRRRSGRSSLETIRRCWTRLQCTSSARTSRAIRWRTETRRSRRCPTSFRAFPFTLEPDSVQALERRPMPAHRTDQEVLDYLEDFAQGIKDRIRFETLVKRIYKDSTEGDDRWIVESVQAEQAYSASVPSSKRDYFDAICDCSGHYYEPSIPYVKGLWRYKKKILHGKWYRGPEAYEGQNVLIVGNSSSGYDMAREIALLFKSQGSDKRVYQSMRHKVEVGIDPSEGPEWASHLEVVAPLDHATENEIVLTDGRRLNVDVVMFGTGYLYSFPYYRDTDQPFEAHPLTKTPPVPAGCEAPDDLDHAAAFPVGGVRVHNLDEQYQTFYYPDPTLAFIALGKQIIPCA